jgi:hypothetical protein
MKKIISLTCGLALCSYLVSPVFAANYTVDGETGRVTVETGATDATVDLTFDPSTNVIMTGASEASAFAHGAYHQAVENKDSGKQFAMASDSSAVYFLDISPDGVATAEDLMGVTNAADLIATDSANWHTM